MGLRFDLRTANWLAYMLQPGAAIPQLDGPEEERETLRFFLQNLRSNYYSSPTFERTFRQRAERASALLDNLEHGVQGERSSSLLRDMLLEFRSYFTRRNWTALLIPSGQSRPVDELLCSAGFLRELVNIRPEDPGLILQLEDAQSPMFPLTDVFPAFRTALAHTTEWPGVLLWMDRGDSVFLPLPQELELTRSCSRWIFSHLAAVAGTDLELLASQYIHEFANQRVSNPPKLHVVQLSDLHVGCNEAYRRLPRVAHLIRKIVEELGNDRIVIAVTGDLLDSPNERNFDGFRNFMEFLANLGTEGPILILGNHDVRNDGYLSESLRMAMRLPVTGGRVIWNNECRVGISCFSSVVSGHLARGFVGEQQMIDIGNEIERNRDWKSYAMLALIHHHPIPVNLPDWYVRPFYARILGTWFESTEELQDSDAFLKFVNDRNFTAVLHGHKHIPRVDFVGDRKLPIIGCGSTVGKVETVEGGTYMSINVITCDVARKRMCARLMAERIPGGGLNEEKCHELVMITGMP
jgi:hypothetical protein